MKRLHRIGIVGAGTMGRRIAYACVTRGKPARLFDVLPKAAEAAVRDVRQLIARKAYGGNLSARKAAAARVLLSSSPSLRECVFGADLVIEAVPENVELKRKVFAEIDSYCAPETRICTNSSSIPGSWLAGATKRPYKIFNANFGTIDDLKVEVMGHAGTAPATLAAAQAFIRDLGLVPIKVRGESVGYATNRVWRAVKKEVLRLLDRGFLTAEEIDRGWMLGWKTAVGPCGVMDKIGLDVVRDIEMIYFRASSDPSDQPPGVLQRMIAEGKLGVKSGEGFYRYPNPSYRRPGWLTDGRPPKTKKKTERIGKR